MTSPASSEISHVSDTALMVAACRADETELEDAFVRDPFAARLAGERGFAILNAVPNSQMLRFGLGIRTRVIDDLLNEALAAHPITTVLSVGCGLDTRPWRLPLSPDLRWIEVDFQDMLEYKQNLMTGETPYCHVERLSVDLNDPTQRQQMYEVAGNARTLVITEGLLLYLPAATVQGLVSESWQQSGIAHWISDITTTAFQIAISGSSRMQSISHVQAPDCLKGEEILDTFYRSGWTTASRRSYLTDLGFAQDRVRRIWGEGPRPALPVPTNDPTGAHCFARA